MRWIVHSLPNASSSRRSTDACASGGKICGPEARSSLHGSLNQMRPRESDRKSTRLNSSHLVISYAVFCLKKKKKNKQTKHTTTVNKDQNITSCIHTKHYFKATKNSRTRIPSTPSSIYLSMHPLTLSLPT